MSCSNTSQKRSNDKKEQESIDSPNRTKVEMLELPEIFDSHNEENEFKELVGNDFEHFVTSFNTISEDEDLDDVRAKVFSGMIPGLGTIKECIVMITDNGFMAAVIDGDTIKYFSSNTNYKTIIPNTIQNWINEKGEKTIKLM